MDYSLSNAQLKKEGSFGVAPRGGANVLNPTMSFDNLHANALGGGNGNGFG